jgi:hypothetical protein
LISTQPNVRKAQAHLFTSRIKRHLQKKAALPTALSSASHIEAKPRFRNIRSSPRRSAGCRYEGLVRIDGHTGRTGYYPSDELAAISADLGVICFGLDEGQLNFPQHIDILKENVRGSWAEAKSTSSLAATP